MTVDPGRAVDTICREIERVQGLHDAALYKEGEGAFHVALEYSGEAIGLRKALCAIFGWPMEEAQKEGRADRYAERWADDWISGNS